MAKDVLLEIGTEEIPAAFMLPALRQLEALLTRGLEARRLRFRRVDVYGTPRRLAAVVKGLAERQADEEREVRGPSADAAFDAEGRPKPAAIGFAKSKGVAVADLEVRETDRGRAVFAVFTERGRPAPEVLAQLLPEVITNLRFAKAMRWAYTSLRFARPIRWLVALYGTEVVPFEIEGLQSGRHTVGHKFRAPKPRVVRSPRSYLTTLRRAHVIADHRERRELIRAEAERAGREAGGQAHIDDDLLDELTFLCEEPTGLWGAFDEEYLSLPEDVLVTVLRKTTRCFPVGDGNGSLLARFVTVHNAPPEATETVRAGHERVVRPRLADARFFFEQDLKSSLSDWQAELKRVIFLEGLGSLHDKCQRLQRLAHSICDRLGTDIDTEAAALRAAELCKADLVSKMVMEPDFSSLQGIMGGIYAELKGEAPETARAIREHYLPLSAAGQVPGGRAAQIVSLTDKLDNLAAHLALGHIPSGTEDPHALRRQAHAVVRIVIERNLALPVGWMAGATVAMLPAGSLKKTEAQVKPELVGLLDQRLEALMEDAGVDYDLARAILSSPHDDLADAWRRARFLNDLRQHQPRAFADAVTVADRVARIVRPAQFDPGDVGPALFRDPHEGQLWEAFAAARENADAALAKGQYESALAALAACKPAIDTYFDEVLVMAEDEALRANRLRLLRQVDEAFLRFADFCEIVQ